MPAKGRSTCATVFGLDVRTDVPLPFLQAATAKPTGRRLDVSLRVDSPNRLPWSDAAELISDQRELDGSVNFRIEADGEAGYLIWGPTYGANLLSGDGLRVLCQAGSGGTDAWQRLLIAQVLPFAAVLRGLEVLHASAVVVDQTAVAFLGPSGAGKTSLALALCRRGADFLADDVLALEKADGELVGHPGTAVAGADRAEADRLLRTGELESREVLATNDREKIVRVQNTAEPAPLRSMFFLDRRPDGPTAPLFEPAADARMLLSATFNLVLVTPERLQTLLDVCACAGHSQVERIVAGPGVDADVLATAVERRLEVST